MVDIAADITTTATFEGSATQLASYSGTYEPDIDDHDWIRVYLEAGEYDFFVSSEIDSSARYDSLVTIRYAASASDANLVEVVASFASDDNGVNANDAGTFTASAGYYYFDVDSWNFGAGTYTISITNSANSIVFNDTHTGNEQHFVASNETRLAGDGDDTIIFTGGDGGIAFGDQGNDIFNGNSSSNRMSGGDGNDTMYGGGGFDVIFGDGGDDWIVGDSENDSLYGGVGNDTIFGGGSADAIRGGAGTNYLYGEEGDDLYFIESATNQITELAGQGYDTVFLKNSSYVLTAGASIELLTLENSGSNNTISISGNDIGQRLEGNNGINTLRGFGGNDIIYGRDDADTLDGGTGNDTLNGGMGADKLIGGTGSDLMDGGLDSDTYVVDSALDRVYEIAGATSGSFDHVQTSVTYALASSFAAIELMTATGSANINLTGNSTWQTLTGNSGNNTLSGLSGQDILVGGKGRDILIGGTDSDTFDFNAVTESGTSSTTRDIIQDFAVGDKIDLSTIDANTASAVSAFGLLAKGTATSAVAAGKIGWYQINAAGTANDMTILRINNDADATIEMTIQIKGLVNLVATDFVL